MSGKFDPEMAMKYERTAREMLKRGMLLSVWFILNTLHLLDQI